MIEESEFGKGLTYCLGLFLKHGAKLEPYMDDRVKWAVAMTWFSGASDHLYEIQTVNLPLHIRGKVMKLKDFCFERRTLAFKEPVDAMKDIEEAVRMAEDILASIDADILGVEVVKATWR